MKEERSLCYEEKEGGAALSELAKVFYVVPSSEATSFLQDSANNSTKLRFSKNNRRFVNYSFMNLLIIIILIIIIY